MKNKTYHITTAYNTSVMLVTEVLPNVVGMKGKYLPSNWMQMEPTTTIKGESNIVRRGSKQASLSKQPVVRAAQLKIRRQ